MSAAEIDALRAEIRAEAKERVRAELENLLWHKQVLLIQQTQAKQLDSHRGMQLCEDGLQLLRERIAELREEYASFGGRSRYDEEGDE